MGLWKKITGLIGIPDWTSGSTKSLVIDDNGTLSKKALNELPNGTYSYSPLVWDNSAGEWIEAGGVQVTTDGRINVSTTVSTGTSLGITKTTNGVALLIDYSGVNSMLEMHDPNGVAYIFDPSFANFFRDIEIHNQKVLRFYELLANGSWYVEIKAPANLTGPVFLTLPSTNGTADQVLKTDGSGNLGWADAGGGFWDETISKTTDKDITSSTTLSDDSELQFSLDASSTYIGEIWVIWDRDTSGGDPYGKIDFVYTGTLTTGRGSTPSAITQNATWSLTGTDNFRFFQSDSANQYVKIELIFETSTSGTLKVQWAQHASQSGASTLRAGTTMSIKKVK